MARFPILALMANMMVAFLPRLLEVAWPDEIPFVERETPQEEGGDSVMRGKWWQMDIYINLHSKLCDSHQHAS